MEQAHQLKAPAAQLRPSPEVVARRLDRTGVLVHLRTNGVFELNETGIRIWELIAEGRSHQEIVSQLVQEFEVDAARASAQLDECVDRLRREGLLSV